MEDDTDLPPPPPQESPSAPWFTWGHQRKYVFDIARELFIHHDLSAKEAIREAQYFIDTFYRLKIDRDTRE